MCEFKVKRKADDTQIADEIVVMGYNDSNQLLLKDILGSGEILESALLLNVNTLNQTTIVLEHPLIKDFIGLIQDISDESSTTDEIERFQALLDAYKE